MEFNRSIDSCGNPAFELTHFHFLRKSFTPKIKNFFSAWKFMSFFKVFYSYNFHFYFNFSSKLLKN